MEIPADQEGFKYASINACSDLHYDSRDLRYLRSDCTDFHDRRSDYKHSGLAGY
jgi:hypothetical protein